MGEIDDGPGYDWSASRDRENEKSCKEEDGDECGPKSWVHGPLCVLTQTDRWCHLYAYSPNPNL